MTEASHGLRGAQRYSEQSLAAVSRKRAIRPLDVRAMVYWGGNFSAGCNGLTARIDRKKTVEADTYRAWLQNIAGMLRNAFSRPLIQAVTAVLFLFLVTVAGLRIHASLSVALCLYIALIVALSFSGNAAVAIFASLAALLCLDYYFAPPVFTVSITDPFDVLSVMLFLGIGLSITTLVTRIKRRTLQLQAANAKLQEQIAARKRTEGVLQQAQEFARANRVMLMGEMTASIAHEINQPLTGIISNAGTSLRYLTASHPDLDAAKQYLDLIVRDGRRAADVINRVRGLARRAPPTKTTVDLNDAVAEVISLAQVQLDRHRTRLRLELLGDLPWIPADRVQLQQIVLNLIINAAEAMNEMKDREPTIVIASGLTGTEQVFVEVRDCGPGLKVDDEDRIFSSFYTTKPNGMGMGLSISRLIAEGHGGELRAFPNVPSGAVFRLTLPLKDTDI